MPKQNDFVTTQHFDEVIEKIQEKLTKLDTVDTKLDKLDKLSEQMDWLIGKYRDHDEEHILLNGKVSDHSDRIDVVEQKLGITP